MARIAFRNFTGGEVTPTLSARYDLQKFGTFLQCCENFIPNLHGDIERRPGTRFVDSLEGPAVLLPFQFNTEPENNYVLVFQDGVIRVATADGLIPDVQLENPYALEDVYTLSHHQAADVVYLAHKKYPLKKITRSGQAPSYTWAISTVALNKSLHAPEKPTAAWHRGPKNSDSNEEYTKNETSTLSYVVTAVDADGVESVASPVGEVTARYPSDWVQGDYVTLTWPAVAGAVEYNVYRESAGYFGFIGVASADETKPTGPVTGLRVGGERGSLVHFSGAVTREIVHAHGYSGARDSDTTTPLTVQEDAGQNAFIADGRLFVYVTFTTRTTDWRWVEDASNADNVTYTWTPFLTTETKKSWRMVTPRDAAHPAGSYAEWVTGELGDSAAAPWSVCGPYTLTPLYDGSILRFQDQNFEPDTAMTPKEDWDPFADGNHPSAVTVHQQRLVLAGTRDNPASFYMSRTGDYENFRKSRPLQDDDPVEYMLASGSVDDIRWLASFGELLIGTSGAEYKATSNGAAITHADVQISTESYWGSSGLQPMIIGNSVMHCQRAGSHVRDLSYSWEKDGYAGNDLSLLAPELVETHSIRQWAFQQSPGSNIWCVREDGVLLCLTYMQEQKVYAWSRHTTQGRVLSCAAMCGESEDVIMLVTERGGKYFLERMARRFREAESIENAFFVDCGVTVNNKEPVEEVGGLEHLEGKEVVVLGDGSPEEGHVVKNGKVTLRYPARTVHVGLNFRSILAPLPVETDMQSGSTMGKRRAYGKCVLRLYRSVGGKYAASHVGDLFDTGAWQDSQFYDLPFVPARFGEAVQPFSGDVEISLPSGQDNDTMIWIMQDRPMPFRLVAIAADVDFGEV